MVMYNGCRFFHSGDNKIKHQLSTAPAITQNRCWRMCLSFSFSQSFDFFCNLSNNFFIFYFVVYAENYKYLSTKFFSKVVKTRFHSLCCWIVTKVRFCCYWLYLNTKCFVAHPTEIIKSPAWSSSGSLSSNFAIGKVLARLSSMTDFSLSQFNLLN